MFRPRPRPVRPILYYIVLYIIPHVSRLQYYILYTYYYIDYMLYYYPRPRPAPARRRRPEALQIAEGRRLWTPEPFAGVPSGGRLEHVVDPQVDYYY